MLFSVQTIMAAIFRNGFVHYGTELFNKKDSFDKIDKFRRFYAATWTLCIVLKSSKLE